VSQSSLEAAIPPGARILLDTSAVLAYLSGAEAASPPATIVLDRFVATGRNRAVVSAITVTEVLVRPFRAASPAALQTVEDFLGHFPNLTVEPVTFEIAREAARVRAATAGPTPDAIVLATGQIVGAAVAVANDGQWAAVISKAQLALALCHLDEHQADAQPVASP